MIETFSAQDKLLTRYLLNELNREEATELEDEMLLDDELAKRAEVVEMNLIDAYVRHELTPSESLRFEGYLADDEHRVKVNRARMFHHSLGLLSEKGLPAVSPLVEQQRRGVLSTLFARPLPAFALATVVLLLIFGLIMFGIRRRTDKSNQLATNSATPAAVNQNGKVTFETPGTNNSSNSETSPAEALPSKDQDIKLARNYSQKQILYGYLHRQNWHGDERGGASVEFVVSPEVKSLALMYELADDKAAQKGIYGIAIKNQYGEKVWPQRKLKEVIKPEVTKAGKLIVVMVPIKVLRDSGPYLFEIDDEFLPSKQFTIRK